MAVLAFVLAVLATGWALYPITQPRPPTPIIVIPNGDCPAHGGGPVFPCR